LEEIQIQHSQIENRDLYIDEPCVASFFIGELGWFLSRFVGHLRFLKHNEYKDRKFILFTELDYHIFVEDFVDYTIELPDWFYNMELERDCYEAPLPDSPAGSLTPPHVYSKIIEYCRTFYNTEKTVEIFPPRGCNNFMIYTPQVFRKFVRPKIKLERDIICVMPRSRSRAAFRNVPEFVWAEVVERLRRYFIVVLCGTPSGSFLSGYKADNVINLIDYNGEDKMDQIVTYLNSAVCSISSQSGLTHVSLQSCCPSYIIGHEKHRHAVVENRFDVPVSFRYVPDYRAIDAETILSDVAAMLEKLNETENLKRQQYEDVANKHKETLNQIIGEVSCQKEK